MLSDAICCHNASTNQILFLSQESFITRISSPAPCTSTWHSKRGDFYPWIPASWNLEVICKFPEKKQKCSAVRDMYEGTVCLYVWNMLLSTFQQCVWLEKTSNWYIFLVFSDGFDLLISKIKRKKWEKSFYFKRKPFLKSILHHSTKHTRTAATQSNWKTSWKLIEQQWIHSSM